MKIRLAFFAVALVALCSAFATKESKFANKKYIWSSTVNQGGGVFKYYVSTDITGQTQGVQYICNASANTCTVEDEETQFQTDVNGRFILSTNNPTLVSGTHALP